MPGSYDTSFRMTPDVLSAAELWIVSYAVEAKMPVGVYGAPNFGEILNCNAARFTKEQVCDAITSLFARRLIALGQRSPASCGMTDESSIGDVDAKLRECSPFVSYLWLTARGGASWESYVQPDWSQFILEETDMHGRVLSITCQHPGLIAWYCAALQQAFYDSPPVASVDPVEAWSATYWKTMFGGQRVRFAPPSKQGGEPGASHSGRLALAHLQARWRQVGFR
jgi:hypothetical protein